LIEAIEFGAKSPLAQPAGGDFRWDKRLTKTYAVINLVFTPLG